MTIDSPPEPPGRTTAAGIAARFERLPLSRWHVGVRLAVGAVTFFEAFDQLLIAYAMPEMRSEWHLSTGASTAILTIGSIGMLLGALLAGRLADRWGRVRVITVCVAVSGVCNLALALCPAPGPFMAVRFLQGLAIGGEVPVAATFIAEITRAVKRGRFVLMYELVFPAGLTVGALVATWLVPAVGWRWMYGLAAVPVLLVFVQRRVPESPRWLADRGRLDEAARTMDRIEAKVEKALGGPLPEPAPLAPAGNGGPTGAATPARGLGGRYRRRLLVVCLLWFTGYFVNYGISSWLPTIYRTHYHLPLGQSLGYSTLTSFAGLIGCFVTALVVDRTGRRRTVAVSLGAAAVALLIPALLGTDAPTAVMLWTSLSAVFFFGANICLYLYTPELFPTRFRALGSSAGGAANRLGVILGPIVVGAVFAGGSMGPVLGMLGAVAAAGCVIGALFAEETANRPLEEVSP